MSDASANLSLPLIQPSQAQKHVTHNEALLILDALVQLSVLSATTTAPPAEPATGDRYLLPSGATGAWSGQTATIAMWLGEAWTFLEPRAGWTTWVADTGAQLRFDGSAWQAEAADLQNLPMVGVNSAADAVNRLSVASAASLLTHEGAGHQLKINKASSGDTASLLFQDGWSGRAEMGLAGSDDFAVKVSADGFVFHTALTATGGSGSVQFPNGAEVSDPSGMGDGPVVAMPYIHSRGLNLVSNGLGSLTAPYNYPAGLTRDPVQTPDVQASFSHAGHASGWMQMTETIPINPNDIHEITCFLRQEAMPGDWSAHAHEDRHENSLGLVCIDADGQEIAPLHHARYKSGGTDSLTTLAAPLTPGDTQVFVSDANGWNDAESDPAKLGLRIDGYRDSHGRSYSFYSRFALAGAFSTTGVNKVTHVITLDAPLPGSMGNPDDASGIWPVGTQVANAVQGDAAKLIVSSAILSTSDQWHRAMGHIGGLDTSGTNAPGNFAPGTVAVRLAWSLNSSNQPGGTGGFPDTGAAQRVWIAGASFRPAPISALQSVTTGPAAGSKTIHVAKADVAGSQIQLQQAASEVVPI